MIATFHNHSKWSDGQATFGEIFAHAKTLDVEILGLSDHFCVYPDGTSPDWSLDPMKVAEYLADVCAYREQEGMEIRVGLEFDWFENHHKVIAPFVERIPLDFRIGAVHHVEMQQFDMDASFWTSKSPAEQDDVYRKYWRLVQEMAESGLFDLAAHIDLPKKLGYLPNGDLAGVIGDALDSIKGSNMVVELNTAGFGKPCADGYPSRDILKKCRSREIPVTLSSDGHIPSHILFKFERGLQNLHEAGFTELVRFRDGERWSEPLADALKRKRS